jgi:hypothetical protein
MTNYIVTFTNGRKEIWNGKMLVEYGKNKKGLTTPYALDVMFVANKNMLPGIKRIEIENK